MDKGKLGELVGCLKERVIEGKAMIICTVERQTPVQLAERLSYSERLDECLYETLSRPGLIAYTLEDCALRKLLLIQGSCECASSATRLTLPST